jgi:acyl carrier protein
MSEIEAKDLKPEMELVSDLGIDSPKALELLVELEEGLGIEIGDEDAARMETVGDVLDFTRALG